VEDGVFTKLTLERGAGGKQLLEALQRWAGRSGEGCASCGGAFYNADGDPNCFGCRRGDEYQLGLVRTRLLRMLRRRYLIQIQRYLKGNDG
jgi:hypothetical protein